MRADAPLAEPATGRSDSAPGESLHGSQHDPPAEDSVHTRFGVTRGGIRLLVPPATPVEYVAHASINPMPRARRRVRGLVQWRGMPYLVVDPAEPPRALPVRCRHPVLVVDGTEAAAALLVDQPPTALRIVGTASDATLPAGPLGPALGEARSDSEGRIWWEVDISRLLRALCDEV